MSPELVHRGSTKDVFRDGDRYRFRFSDRYSVFDWGEMPDHLERKGEALAGFTRAIYQKLAAAGVRHHLIDAAARPDEIIVKPFTVVRDGSSLAGKGNVFLPLEVIFRLGYARGSSLAKRMKAREDWRAAGLDRAYVELEFFPTPVIEFTTKHERFDRPLTHAEAKDLAGLDDREWASLLALTATVARSLREIFRAHEIDLWDGKIELALDERREIVLVDSIGPDELRLTRGGVQLSKEIIRQYYRGTDWYRNLDQVKETHGVDFKNFIAPPPTLPREFKAAVEDMYLALADLVGNRNGAERDLARVVDRLRSFL
jgi:phosphoribosylaminoimidazole-succinocarboxamide synthase